MAKVCALLEEWLPSELVVIIDSFFTRPIRGMFSYTEQSLQIGKEGHPEHILSNWVGWISTFEGIVANNHIDLCLSYLQEMEKQYKSTRAYNLIMGVACAANRLEFVSIIAKYAIKCDDCGILASLHMSIPKNE